MQSQYYLLNFSKLYKINYKLGLFSSQYLFLSVICMLLIIVIKLFSDMLSCNPQEYFLIRRFITKRSLFVNLFVYFSHGAHF